MTSPIREIELSIQQAKKTVELSKALERLESNRDFQTVIQNSYLRDEAIRLVHAKSNPGLQSPEKQAAVIRDIDSIGTLATYLRQIHQFADAAQQAINDSEAELQSIVLDEV